MKLVHVGAISTGTVIILGVILVMPAFFPPVPKSPVLLVFSINSEENLPKWCEDLSSVLQKRDIKAAVFVTGKIASEYPQCVKDFSNNVDIGSQTYDYVDLTSIRDYSQQLDEIRNGKLAVDTAGNLESKLFKAPYGSVDGNIYSLLTRSDILADFSYNNQYNKYYNGQFIKFDLRSYDGVTLSDAFMQKLDLKNNQVSINYDNSTPVEKINEYLSKLENRNIKFIDASDLTNLDLTVRKGGWIS